MSTFMEAMSKNLKDAANTSITENGAVGYNTTGDKIVDMNFKVPSMRNKVVNGNELDVQQIMDEFDEALAENPDISVKWLFYLRDIRGGLGERKIFRTLFRHLLSVKPDAARHLIKKVPEFGRWDDILDLLTMIDRDTPLKEARIIGSYKKEIISIIHDQIISDVMNMEAGNSVSLLAKWLPSITSEHYHVREKAKLIARGLGIHHKDYRVIVSKLRSYIKIVEKDMSNNEWGEINYSTLPSRAALLYSKAFMRHDEARYKEYIESLKNGEAKINVSTLYPHEIITRFRYALYGLSDETNNTDILEEMWKALPDKFGDKEPRIIVVRDGSSSMNQHSLAKSNSTAMDVGTALAIYFAERLKGEFHNKFITFSKIPRLVSLDGYETLYDKIRITYQNSDMENTDIEAVFEMILHTAVEANMKQGELPETILIISDMEFDGHVGSTSYSRPYMNRLFDEIQKKYDSYNYKLPKVVFWNVGSTTDTIPMKENDLGVTLVSGYSLNILQAVLSDKSNLFEVLLEILLAKRYESIFLDESAPKLEYDTVDSSEEKKADDYGKAIKNLIKGNK